MRRTDHLAHKPDSSHVVLSRESYGYLIAILAIKETGYITTTQNKILPGGRSPIINK
jgi:hypothetical protein